MCGGDSVVEHCSDTQPVSIGEIECAGIQMYGIGAGVNDIQAVLTGLVKNASKMFEVIDAACKVVDAGSLEIPALHEAVRKFRDG
jgi:hypothetical protein